MANPITSNEDFKAAIKSYIVARGFHGAGELAKELGIPSGTIEDWGYRGLKSEGGRRRIVERHPQLFTANGSLPPTKASVSPNPIPPREDSHPDRKIVVIVKAEVVRGDVAALTKRLEWFLYQASPEERNQFRDVLGEDWKHFLELCRAMTGETAFEIAKKEGRIQ